MATVAQTISDLIGSDMNSTLVTSYEDLINSGFNFIADLIPADSELWSANNLKNSSASGSDSGFVINNETFKRKVILVTRTESGGIARAAQEITYEDYLTGQDTTSIFYHGRSTTLPIYTYLPTGALIISPSIGTGDSRIVYYFDYIVSAISTLTSNQLFLGHDADDVATTNLDGKGFPEKAFFSGCIKSAINLMQAKISNAAQDDEDMELIQILQAQGLSLEKLLQGELTALRLPDKIIGVPNDTQ